MCGMKEWENMKGICFGAPGNPWKYGGGAMTGSCDRNSADGGVGPVAAFVLGLVVSGFAPCDSIQGSDQKSRTQNREFENRGG